MYLSTQLTLQCVLVVNRSAILYIVKTQLVIFGMTGDLSRRKLLPALESLISSGEYDDLRIIGVSRRHVDVAELLSPWPTLSPVTSLYSMNLAESQEYEGLKTYLAASDADQTLFYLAVPPGAAADIVDFLGSVGLNTPHHHILFEKPFGYNITSAQEMIDRTARYYSEEQLFRIDHYMAKEIAVELQNIRKTARASHHSWDNQSINAITIMATEAIGIEGRAQFYEQTGALRDFVQGHLMQLLALVLMDGTSLESLPTRRLHALQQVEPINPTQATRAQYEGYAEEVGNPGSRTETFVAFMARSTHPSWSTVPIRVVTGKALSEKRSYVSISYSDGTEDIFDEDQLLRVGPGRRDAYERVLVEAIAGRKSIFTSSQEVIRSWEILAPLQQQWELESQPLLTYPPGTDVSALR